MKILPRAPGFLSDLEIEETHPGEKQPYTIVADLIFDDGCLSFVVPAGTRYDRASVPWGLRWIVPIEVLDYAAAPHDMFYELAYDKKVSDALFYMIVRAEGKANALQARAAWRAVWLGGWFPWLASKRRAERSG